MYRYPLLRPKEGGVVFFYSFEILERRAIRCYGIRISAHVPPQIVSMYLDQDAMRSTHVGAPYTDASFLLGANAVFGPRIHDPLLERPYPRRPTRRFIQIDRMSARSS